MKTLSLQKAWSLRLSKGLILILLLFTACSKPKAAVQTSAPLSEPEVSKVDYDLSNMNFTMISSFFFQMLIEPDEYENKTFKIKGKFQTFDNEENPALPYFSVIMNDVTMCCQEGIDFIWEGDHKYPDDYPQPDQEITIVGKYIVTEIDGFTYNYILASDIIL